MKKFLKIFGKVLLVMVLLVALGGVGTMTYFHYAPPSQTCLSCHEMTSQHDRWMASAHKQVHCRECHGGSLTLNTHAVKEHTNRLFGHFSIKSADEIRLTHEQVMRVSESCGKCHSEQQKKWASGGHAATYKTIFLDSKQNTRELLNGDCLRCHGMFFEGTTEDLVGPMDKKGPWKLNKPELENVATMPCLACHAVHVARPEKSSAQTSAQANAQTGTGSVAKPAASGLYVRREKTHYVSEKLPAFEMYKDGKTVKVSADVRQRQCVQCHAPKAFHEAGSADDRTPTGVHAGLSCLSCHDPHSGKAEQSCATCHGDAVKRKYAGDVYSLEGFKKAAGKVNVHFVGEESFGKK